MFGSTRLTPLTVRRRGRNRGCHERTGARHRPPEGPGRSQRRPGAAAGFPEGVCPSKQPDGIRRFLRAGKGS